MQPNLGIGKEFFYNIKFTDECKNFYFIFYINFLIIYLEAYKDFDKKVDELKLKLP